MAFKNTLIKCLIWLGFLFVNSAITTGLVYAGVRLGVIPTVLLFAVACYAARSCCKAFDRKHAPLPMGEIIQLTNAKSVQPEQPVKENEPRRVSQKPVILTLSVLVVVLTASCCLLEYHLQCVQESLSAANKSVLEAFSYLRMADERLDRYVDYIEEYIPRKYVSFVDRFSYSRTFESYQRSHPIPDPDPYPWNK